VGEEFLGIQRKEKGELMSHSSTKARAENFGGNQRQGELESTVAPKKKEGIKKKGIVPQK